MLTVEPGTHGSTYGGNPLGSAVAIKALEIVEEEQLTQRAERLGEIFRQGLRDLQSQDPMISTIRGKGLLNAIVIDESKTGGHSAWDLCMLMKEKGLLVGRALKIAHVKSSSPSARNAAGSQQPVHPALGSGASGDPAAGAGGKVPVSEPLDRSDANVILQAKPTHQNIIRLAPPLVIDEDQIKTALKIIAEAVKELPTLKGEKEEKVLPAGEAHLHPVLEN